jgi:hypothetical protein
LLGTTSEKKNGYSRLQYYEPDSGSSSRLAGVPSIVTRPLRARARGKSRVRVAQLAVLCLLALSFTFLIGSYVNAFYDTLWVGMGGADFDAYLRAEGPFTTEMWLRRIVPPTSQQRCYTGQAAACELADDYVGRLNTPAYTWRVYGITIGLSVLAAMITGLMVWRFTRSQDRHQSSPISDRSSSGDGA